MPPGGTWLDGLEERARARLDPAVLEYVRQGSGAEVTVSEASDAWAAVRLAPRVLTDVGAVDLGVHLPGGRLPVPWGVAPTTLQRAVHPDGDVAMAEATRDAGSLLVVSSNTGTPFAAIGATGVRWWLQLYLTQDRRLVEPVLEAAVAAGAQAVVLTVDTPVVSTKSTAGSAVWDVVPPASVRANFAPGHDERPGAAKARDLSPDDLHRVADRTGLPVVVKGVLRADDARRCCDAGVTAVWVSNHGGRQLDRAVSTAAALRPVVDAVGGRCAVYVDGGLRHGLDVVTALALGADCCFVGRPAVYALAEGRDGVARWHAELRTEVEEAMTLCGAPDVRALRTLVDTPH